MYGGWELYEPDVQVQLDEAARADTSVVWYYNKNHEYEIDPNVRTQRNLATTAKIKQIRRRGEIGGAADKVEIPPVPIGNRQGEILEEDRDPAEQTGETRAWLMLEREHQCQEEDGVDRAQEIAAGLGLKIPAPPESNEIVFGGSPRSSLYACHAARFNTGIRDYDALSRIGFPTKRIMEWDAEPDLRMMEEPEWVDDIEDRALKFRSASLNSRSWRRP